MSSFSPPRQGRGSPPVSPHPRSPVKEAPREPVFQEQLVSATGQGAALSPPTGVLPERFPRARRRHLPHQEQQVSGGPPRHVGGSSLSVPSDEATLSRSHPSSTVPSGVYDDSESGGISATDAALKRAAADRKQLNDHIRNTLTEYEALAEKNQSPRFQQSAVKLQRWSAMARAEAPIGAGAPCGPSALPGYGGTGARYGDATSPPRQGQSSSDAPRVGTSAQFRRGATAPNYVSPRVSGDASPPGAQLGPRAASESSPQRRQRRTGAPQHGPDAPFSPSQEQRRYAMVAPRVGQQRALLKPGDGSSQIGPAAPPGTSPPRWPRGADVLDNASPQRRQISEGAPGGMSSQQLFRGADVLDNISQERRYMNIGAPSGGRTSRQLFRDADVLGSISPRRISAGASSGIPQQMNSDASPGMSPQQWLRSADAPGNINLQQIQIARDALSDISVLQLLTGADVLDSVSPQRRQIIADALNTTSLLQLLGGTDVLGNVSPQQRQIVTDALSERSVLQLLRDVNVPYSIRPQQRQMGTSALSNTSPPQLLEIYSPPPIMSPQRQFRGAGAPGSVDTLQRLMSKYALSNISPSPSTGVPGRVIPPQIYTDAPSGMSPQRRHISTIAPGCVRPQQRQISTNAPQGVSPHGLLRGAGVPLDDIPVDSGLMGAGVLVDFVRPVVSPPRRHTSVDAGDDMRSLTGQLGTGAQSRQSPKNRRTSHQQGQIGTEAPRRATPRGKEDALQQGTDAPDDESEEESQIAEDEQWPESPQSDAGELDRTSPHRKTFRPGAKCPQWVTSAGAPEGRSPQRGRGADKPGVVRVLHWDIDGTSAPPSGDASSEHSGAGTRTVTSPQREQLGTGTPSGVCSYRERLSAGAPSGVGSQRNQFGAGTPQRMESPQRRMKSQDTSNPHMGTGAPGDTSPQRRISTQDDAGRALRWQNSTGALQHATIQGGEIGTDAHGSVSPQRGRGARGKTSPQNDADEPDGMSPKKHRGARGARSLSRGRGALGLSERKWLIALKSPQHEQSSTGAPQFELGAGAGSSSSAPSRVGSQRDHFSAGTPRGVDQQRQIGTGAPGSVSPRRGRGARGKTRSQKDADEPDGMTPKKHKGARCAPSPSRGTGALGLSERKRLIALQNKSPQHEQSSTDGPVGGHAPQLELGAGVASNSSAQQGVECADEPSRESFEQAQSGACAPDTSKASLQHRQISAAALECVRQQQGRVSAAELGRGRPLHGHISAGAQLGQIISAGAQLGQIISAGAQLGQISAGAQLGQIRAGALGTLTQDQVGTVTPKNVNPMPEQTSIGTLQNTSRVPEQTSPCTPQKRSSKPEQTSPCTPQKKPKRTSPDPGTPQNRSPIPEQTSPRTPPKMSPKREQIGPVTPKKGNPNQVQIGGSSPKSLSPGRP